MHKLEQYYKGDENWNQFVELYDEFWEDNEIQKDLVIKLNGHIDLAKVIYGKTGNHGSLEWIYEKVPALDYLSPIECTRTTELVKRLKVCLKRMPS